MKNPLHSAILSVLLTAGLVPPTCAQRPGSPDTSFSPSEPGGHGTPITWLSLQPDGHVIVGGDLDEPDGLGTALGFLNPNGRRERTLTINPAAYRGTLDRLYQSYIAAQPDGKLLVLGQARLNPDGNLDPTFKQPVWFTNVASVNGMALLPDGRAYLSGEWELNENSGLRIWRILNTGELDPSFPSVPNGDWVKPPPQLFSGFDSRGYHYRRDAIIVPLETGAILVGGTFNRVQGVTRTNLARLRPDGSVDPTFADIGLNGRDSMVQGSVVAISPLADGTILVGGEFTQVAGQPRACLARLHSDGSLDMSFNARLARTHEGLPPFVFAIQVQRNGKILIGGEFETVAGVPRYGLARLYPDGSLDEDFNAALMPTAGHGFRTVQTMLLQPDGNILIGGNFSGAGGFLAERVVRLFGGEAVKFLPGTARRLASGALEFQISAEPGRQITLESTPSLSPLVWQPLSTNTITSSPLIVADPDAAKFPQRFYRAVSR